MAAAVGGRPAVLQADGETGKNLGNETLRWNPDDGWLEVRLPAPLAHLANRPHARYRLSSPVEFSYRGGEVAARAATRTAVQYTISYDPARNRRYLDAAWARPGPPGPVPRRTADIAGRGGGRERRAPCRYGKRRPQRSSRRSSAFQPLGRALHWLAPLREHHPDLSGHHAAALVLGRRGQGHRARRRATRNRATPEDVARPAQARTRKSPVAKTAPRKPAAPRGTRPPPGGKTGLPPRTPAGNQAAQDRSAPPAAQRSLSRSDQERSRCEGGR